MIYCIASYILKEGTITSSKQPEIVIAIVCMMKLRGCRFITYIGLLFYAQKIDALLHVPVIGNSISGKITCCSVTIVLSISKRV